MIRQARKRFFGWKLRLTLVMVLLTLTGAGTYYFLLRDKSPEQAQDLLAQAHAIMDQSGSRTEEMREAVLQLCKEIETLNPEGWESHYLRYQIAKDRIVQPEVLRDAKLLEEQLTTMRESLKTCDERNPDDPEIKLARCALLLDYRSYFEGRFRSLEEKNSFYNQAISWAKLASANLKEELTTLEKGSDAYQAATDTDEKANWYQVQLYMVLGKGSIEEISSQYNRLSLDKKRDLYRATERFFDNANQVLLDLTTLANNSKYAFERARIQFELNRLEALTPKAERLAKHARDLIFSSLAKSARDFKDADNKNDPIQGALKAIELCREYQAEAVAHRICTVGIRFLSTKFDVTRLHLERARLYAVQGYYQEAEQSVEGVLSDAKHAQRQPEAYTVLSEIYELSRRPDSSTPEGAVINAEQCLKIAWREAPDGGKSPFLERLGDYYRRQGQFQKAFEQYKEAWTEDPDSLAALGKAAREAYRLGWSDDAKKYYQELLKRVPADYIAIRMLQLIEQDAGPDLNEALAKVDRKLETDPNSPELLFQAADLLYRAANISAIPSERDDYLERGSRRLSRLEEVGSTGLETRVDFLRFKYDFSLEQFPQAKTSGENALKQSLSDADRTWLRIQLANTYLRLGKPRRANVLADEVGLVTTGKRAPEIFSLRARIYREIDGSYSDRVIKLFQQALDSAVSNGIGITRAHLELARAYRAQKNIEDASKHFEAAVTHEPSNLLAWRQYSDFAFAAHAADRKKARATSLETLDRAIAANQDNEKGQAEIHRYKFLVQISAKNTEEAEKEIQRAMALAPQSPTYPMFLAQLQEQTGRFVDALETYRAVHRISPFNAQAKRKVYDLLAHLYRGPDLDAARTDFVDRLVEHNSGDPENLALKARHSAALGQWREAIENYTRSVALRPSDIPASKEVLDLIAAYSEKPDADAISFLENMVDTAKHSGAHFAYRMLLANAYLDGQQSEKGASLLEGIHEKGKGSIQSYILLGRCYLAREDRHLAAEDQFNTAIELIGEALTQRGTDPGLINLRSDARYYIARLHWDAKEPGKSLSVARLAFLDNPLRGDIFGLIEQLYDKKHPNSPDAMRAWVEEQPRWQNNHFLLNLSGKLYLQEEKLAEAEKNFQKASQIMSEGWIVPLINLTIARERQGNMTGAIRVLERATRAGYKSDWKAYARLGELYRLEEDAKKAEENFQKAQELNPEFKIPAPGPG